MTGTVVRRRSRALLPSLGVVTLALFANYTGILSVLIPSQVAAIDPANKVGNLALVTAVSAAFTIPAQPLFGALSDRTRSGLGRRAPWMIAGSVAAAAFLLGMSGLGSVFWLCVFWTVAQFALNAVDIASSAFLVDCFPPARRGIASAIFGIGAIAGGAVGTVLAGRFVGHGAPGYALLGLGLLAVVVVFVLINREPSTRGHTVVPFELRAFVRGFWIDPRRHPDFAWAFASRFAFVLGYYVVYDYLLYLLTDYIGVPRSTAAWLVGVVTVIGVVAIAIAVVVGGWWSDRIGGRRVFLLVACGFLVVAFLIPLVVPTIAGVLAFAVVQGLGFGLYLCCGSALISELLPEGGASPAKDLGIYNVATNLPQAVAPVVAAVVIQSAGGYPGLFLLAIVAVIVSAVLVTRIRGVR